MTGTRGNGRAAGVLAGSVLAVALVASACADAPAAPAPAPPVGLTVSGAVHLPSAGVTAAALRAMPQQTLTVDHSTLGGQRHHVDTGVPLVALIPPSALATDLAHKNDLVAFAILAVGADGYTSAVAYGEIATDLGNGPVLVALTEDGRPLPRPELVFGGDVRGARSVSDLVDLHVVRLGPGTS